MNQSLAGIEIQIAHAQETLKHLSDITRDSDDMDNEVKMHERTIETLDTLKPTLEVIFRKKGNQIMAPSVSGLTYFDNLLGSVQERADATKLAKQRANEKRLEAKRWANALEELNIAKKDREDQISRLHDGTFKAVVRAIGDAVADAVGCERSKVGSYDADGFRKDHKIFLNNLQRIAEQGTLDGHERGQAEVFQQWKQATAEIDRWIEENEVV